MRYDNLAPDLQFFMGERVTKKVDPRNFNNIKSGEMAGVFLDFMQTTHNITKMIEYGNTEEEIMRMWKKVLKACLRFEVPVDRFSLNMAQEVLSNPEYRKLARISGQENP